MIYKIFFSTLLGIKFSFASSIFSMELRPSDQAPPSVRLTNQSCKTKLDEMIGASHPGASLRIQINPEPDQTFTLSDELSGIIDQHIITDVRQDPSSKIPVEFIRSIRQSVTGRCVIAFQSPYGFNPSHPISDRIHPTEGRRQITGNPQRELARGNPPLSTTAASTVQQRRLSYAS